MPRITVTIGESLDEYLESESGDGAEFDSKSEVMRRLAERGRGADHLEERIEELERQLESVRDERDELIGADRRVDELESTVERLRNEKRLLLEERQEKAELAEWAEEKKSASQRWREAGITTRLKWRVFGMPTDETSA